MVVARCTVRTTTLIPYLMALRHNKTWIDNPLQFAPESMTSKLSISIVIVINDISNTRLAQQSMQWLLMWPEFARFGLAVGSILKMQQAKLLPADVKMLNS